MPEQGERKYYAMVGGEYEEISCMGGLEEKNSPIKSIFCANNEISIALETSKISSAEKRALRLYRGERKKKHFYRK